MRVYLSGVVSRDGTLTNDEIQVNIDRFNSIAAVLRKSGYEVLSPVELPRLSSWAEYMKLCIPMVCESDALVALPGFEDSRGAIVEISVANTVNVPIFLWPNLPALET